MSKVQGIKIVRRMGSPDFDATLDAWDAAYKERYAKEREAFADEFDALVAATRKLDPIFTEALTAFWEKYPKQRIPKATIVDMCVSNMVVEGKLPITEATGAKDLFGAFLDQNASDFDSADGTWMHRQPGRNGGFQVRRAEQHIK